ncbi:JAB domain-containing protein [Methanorbis furvi]|uniref:MPN domain-containing protein n=1 Tax=Methanorbis furvi TaxID=3028299 RepID=A0AAE4MBN7_9EURY|nr:hypothetical protein [Methanocorpusculaceae archaeon Ag1]
MSLKNTAEIDRPREKLIANGPQNLTLAELVAAIIGRGTAGNDALKIGKMVSDILMENSYNTTVKEIASVDGMGPAKACQILAALELARRFPPPDRKHAVIKRAEDILPFVSQYRYDKQENVVAATLSGAHEILNIRLVTRGLVNESHVHPREVFAGAVTDRAAAIILIHNHPSGNLAPSRQDILVTEKIQAAGTILGIKLLDHIIIGPCDGFQSILEEEEESGENDADYQHAQ